MSAFPTDAVTRGEPRRRVVAYGIASVLALAGCNGSGDGPRARQERGSAETSLPARDPRADLGASEEPVREYALRGTVARVDRKSGIVAIRHEEIPGYMPSMTMPFDLREDPILEDLQVGDKVEGNLTVSPESSKLEDLVITELAAPASPEGGSGATGSKATVLELGAVVPDFSMTTQDGTPLSLTDLRGKVVVLTFIYTRCPLPDYCPLMDRKFADLARRVALLGDDGQGIRLLSVSFDPEHDTPDVLARHARVVGAKPPRWTFAVAAHEELRKVAEALGLTYGATEREIIHTLSTAVIGPDGRLSTIERGNAWSVDEIFSAVRTLLKEAIGRP